jgi:predicted dehydrogenase
VTADRPLSLLVCGAGRVVERLYGPAFRLSRAVSLAGVVDPRADRRAWAEKSLRVPASATLEDALAAVTPAGVVVATPPAQLIPMARAAQRAGLPVLIEKPGARSEAEAESLLAWEGGPPVRLGLSRRYWRRYRSLKRTATETGDWFVQIMTNHRQWAPVEPREWTSLDLIEDLLPHAYDLVTAVLGAEFGECGYPEVEHDSVGIGFSGGFLALMDGPAWTETVFGNGISVESMDWKLHRHDRGRRRGFMTGAARTLLARSGVRPLEPVEAIARLLDDFALDVRLRRQNDDLRALGALFDQVRTKLEAT